MSGYANFRAALALRRAGHSSAPHESGAPVTQYHEDKVTYRRRGAPRRVRRRARGRSRAFLRQYTKLSPPQSILRTYSFNMSAVANTQATYNFMAYSFYNTDTLANLHGTQGNDVYSIASSILPQYYSTLLSSTVNNRLVFKSCHMDVLFSNNGTNSAYLDIYYVKCRRESVSDPVSDYNNIDTVKWTGTNTVSAGTLGITPFDSHDFGAHWLITKSRRIILPPAQVCEISMSDHKQHWFDPRDQATVASGTSNVTLARKGWTFGLVVTVLGAALDNVNQQPVAVSNLAVYVNKTYKVAIPPSAGPVTTGSV